MTKGNENANSQVQGPSADAFNTDMKNTPKPKWKQIINRTKQKHRAFNTLEWSEDRESPITGEKAMRK